MTGFAWLAGGEGTTFSKPAARDERSPLLPKDGQLCAGGTIAGLRCVNEGLPQMRCNWERNWGVAIGFNVKADGKAWGEEAAAEIAVDFRGRWSRYRLSAHRAGDPSRQTYCIDDYRSGQSAQPRAFKTECWADRGESLPDFKGVDSFHLVLASGTDLTAFRYCISGVRIVP
jgi:hypothetical protein